MVAFLDKRAALFHVVASDDGALIDFLSHLEKVFAIEGSKLPEHPHIVDGEYQAADAEEIDTFVFHTEAVYEGQQAYQDAG